MRLTQINIVFNPDGKTATVTAKAEGMTRAETSATVDVRQPDVTDEQLEGICEGYVRSLQARFKR